MKNGKHWFNLLSKKEQKKFKINAIDYKGFGWFYYLTNNFKCESFETFITRAFVWCDSVEEIDAWVKGEFSFYWAEIATRYNNYDKLLIK